VRKRNRVRGGGTGRIGREERCLTDESSSLFEVVAGEARRGGKLRGG
jgi:hypothetical protein